MTEDEFWYWLYNIPDITYYQIKKLIEYFGSPEGVHKAESKEITKVLKNDSSEIRANIRRAIKKDDYVSQYDILDKQGIQFIHRHHSLYPKRFQVLEDPPHSFYLKGNMPDPNRYAVSIVGARACTQYGREMTDKYARYLALQDVQIISGMALGIDTYASKGALKENGKTFVVLGTGLDVIYPRENTDLYYEILMMGGGIISEYPPGTPGTAWHFPHRNRLISALSDKVLIMEAKKRSGTLTTARHALDQGIDIYALPGRANDPLSVGCNKMIADGSGILIEPSHLMEDLLSAPVRLSEGDVRSKERDVHHRETPRWLSGPAYEVPKINYNEYVDEESEEAAPEEKKLEEVIKIPEAVQGAAAIVYKALYTYAQPIDQLLVITGLNIKELLSAISELVILGYVEEEAKDIYRRIS